MYYITIYSIYTYIYICILYILYRPDGLCWVQKGSRRRCRERLPRLAGPGRLLRGRIPTWRGLGRRDWVEPIYVCMYVCMYIYIWNIYGDIYGISIMIWMVVEPTPLKNMKVNRDDDIPNIWKNEKCSKQPTRYSDYYGI